MMDAGFHSGVPMARYIAEKATGASLLHTLDTRCARAAWHESSFNANRPADDSTDDQAAGTVAHSLLLEGRADIVEIIDAKDWRASAAKEARDAARKAGKVPVLIDRMPKIIAMVEAAKAYIESLREDEPGVWMTLQPAGGESEVTAIWDDDGLRCKMRPDRISHDRRIIVDVKTTGSAAEPESWYRWQATKLGYPIHSGHYRRGIQRLANVLPTYLWLVIEQDLPHLCSLVGLDRAAQALADSRASRVRSEWAECVRTDNFPAYPNRAVYIEAPPWEFTEEEARGGLGGIAQKPELMGREYVLARESEEARWARNATEENSPP